MTTETHPAVDDERAVIVTGAARGIGHALALQLDAAGYPLVLIDFLADELAALETDLTRPAHTVVADLAEWDGIDKAVSTIGGLHQPAALVNNAGYYRGEPLARYEPDDIEHDYRVNVMAPMMLTQAFATPLVQQRQHGSVIHVASTAGEVGSSDAVYGSAKAAVIGLTKSQAMNYAPWVRVNCVSPGMVHDTSIEDRIPGYRHAEYARQELLDTRLDAASVAEVIAMLLTPVSRNMTAAVIPVDDGAYPR